MEHVNCANDRPRQGKQVKSAGKTGIAKNPTAPSFWSYPMTASPARQPAASYTRFVRWIWPCLVMGTVFLASGRSQVSSPNIIGIDKFAHFLVFGLLANLIQRSLPESRYRTFLAIGIVSLLGISDEWHQSFTPGRSVELVDWLCDTAGASLAASLYARVRWYRVLLESRLGAGRRTKAVPPATLAAGQVDTGAPSPTRMAADSALPSGD